MEYIGPISVIDIGAHFVRLEVAQATGKNGNYQVLEQLSQVVPLGQDVFTSGRISTKNMLLVCDIINDFKKVINEYSADNIKAVATSAVREASNRELFIDRVKRITGINLKVLESSEESRIMYLALKDSIGKKSFFNNEHIMTCALGTGSTQISLIKSGIMQSSEAVRIGSLRIVEELGNPVTSKQLKLAIKPFVGSKTRGVFIQAFHEKIDKLMATGSSVRALLNFCNKEKLDSDSSLNEITKDEFQRIYKTIINMSYVEISDKFRISETLAQSIEPCCGILFHLIKATGVKKVIIPSINTREAILKDFLRELNQEEDPFVTDLLSCVRNLGKRYNYDQDHSEVVTEKALLIFDKTHSLHGISEKEKIYLEIASMLHDIGLFINSRKHHKHSYYIISNSQLPGLTDGEKNLIACIARYHRSAMPKNSHPEYALLTPEEKVLVSDLAAMLRVADSLEFAHNLKIKDVIINYRSQIIEIIVDGIVDIILENWTLRTKANLFKEVFGFKLKITGSQ